jgi:hypothetical protein
MRDLDILTISVADKKTGNRHTWKISDEYFCFDDEKYEIESLSNDKWLLEDNNKLYICIWARLAVFNDRTFTIYSVV